MLVSILCTILTWLGFFLSIAIFPIAIVTRIITSPFDRNLKAVHIISCGWGSFLSWVNPLWSTTVIGREKIKSSQPAVLISNHQSMLDILVLYRLFKHFKWVSKIEMFNVPIVGWNMSLNKYVAVDRGNKVSHVKMMTECEDYLRNGSSIMIFPEGTRSKNGEIHGFKEGAFRMALSGKVPIIPIIIDGTLNGFPRKGLIFRNKCKILVKVLDPIPYESFANLSPKEIGEKAANIMKTELKILREKSV